MADDFKTLKLGPKDKGRELTHTAFVCALLKPPWRYQRLDGKLVVGPGPAAIEIEHSRPWRLLLAEYWGTRPDHVLRVDTECWVSLQPDTDRVGDIGVFLRKSRRDEAPALVFEVANPDRPCPPGDSAERKRADYHRAGVLEYVIIDRFERRLTVLVASEEGYSETILTCADIYSTALLPGFVAPLADLL